MPNGGVVNIRKRKSRIIKRKNIAAIEDEGVNFPIINLELIRRHCAGRVKPYSFSMRRSAYAIVRQR